MKAIKYLVLIIILFTQNIHGQSWYYKRVIPWVNPLASADSTSLSSLFNFAFAEFHDYNSKLPVFTDVFDWQSAYNRVELSFFSAKYEVLPGSFHTDPVFADLTDSVRIQHHVAIERGNPHLVVSLVPFRINGVTGKVERLTEFILKVSSQASERVSYGLKKAEKISASVLASGEWFKIRVPSTGIYKLTYEQLKTIGLSDPASLRIFGNGGQMLPEDIRQGSKDDLRPLGFYMNKGSDNVFNQGDYILFYGTGPENWTYNSSQGVFQCERNYYSDHGYYFLTSNNGPVDIIPAAEQPSGPVSFHVDNYDYYYHHERNELNLIKSGREFYGETFFDSQSQRDFSFVVPDLIMEEPVRVTANVLSRSADSAVFLLSHNGNTIQDFRIRQVSITNYTSVYAYNQQRTAQFFPGNENFTLRMRYQRREPRANGWLDFITLNAKARLRLNASFITFRNQTVVAPDAITRFTLDNVNSNTIIWDVTELNNIKNVSWQAEGNEAVFLSQTDNLREFVAFRSDANFPSPEFTGSGLGRIENQNLHGIKVPELIIISHSGFLEEAKRLAGHREMHDGMSVYVTTPEEVYNEFSSGTPDVTAIRNFVKYLYDRGMDEVGTELKYLLLFGRGSYDNKGVKDKPGNFILTYQSENSLSPVASYVSDDFFALLDPGEQMFNGMLDIGVGRIPVTTSSQARVVVDKIIDYESFASFGSWRNTVCFIGDDGDNNIHFNQANQLATYVSNNYPSFNVNKIFLDAYKKVTTPTGQRYPDVKRAVNEQVERGALIVNYTGHGGVEGLAHERILEINDVVNWRNKSRYPLFVTATCEFTRFDDPDKTSAGEEVLLRPNAGGIALFTTTRLVYSGPNHVLNERFFEIVFECDNDDMSYRLGDIMKYSKNRTGSGINKRNFSLIGDPSMRLGYPKHNIVTDTVNSIHISEAIDTLKALSKITISGHIQNSQGNLMNNFNGVLFPTVFDKPMQLSTLANDGGEKKSFTLQNNILYRGKVSVTNGYFNFSFIVPKDINYAFGPGKLSYYAYDSLYDATGAYTNITIGGTAENFFADTEGPEVEVFMNNQYFRPGDITDENPLLFVRVSDKSGINTTGNGIGHDITAILNNNTFSPLILNEYFESDLDSYTSGVVQYPLFNLEEGRHVIDVRVWDIHNNSGEGYIEFVVAKSEEFFLNEIFNYPNPFTDRTWFSFGHNRSGTDLDIRVDIFSLNGELIRTISSREFGTGYRSQPLEWDGRSAGGADTKEGIYIFRIRVKTSEGQEAFKSGKLIIVR